jgi:hypothetical protein
MQQNLYAVFAIRDISEMTLKFTPEKYSTVASFTQFNNHYLQSCFQFAQHFILTTCLQGISLKYITFGSQAI